MQASTSRWRARPGVQLPGRRWRERTSLPTLGWTSSPSTWWSSSPPSKYLALRHRDNWSSLSWQACQPESAFFCEGKYCKQDDSLSWNYIHGVEGDRTTLQIYFGKNIRAHNWEVTPPPSPVFGHPASRCDNISYQLTSMTESVMNSFGSFNKISCLPYFLSFWQC